MFCREFFVYQNGVCCDPQDFSCLVQKNDFCSNQFKDKGMQLFSCPFETGRCGTGPQVLIPSGGEKVIQSKGFDNHDVCYYWIEAMPNAT